MAHFIKKYTTQSIGLFLLSAGFVSVGVAQNALPIFLDKLSVGACLGYTHAGLYGKDIDHISATPNARFIGGFHGGITLDNPISPKLLLKHELLFNQKGSQLTFVNASGDSYTGALRANYLDLYPVNIGLRHKRLQLYTGIYISTLLSATLAQQDKEGHTRLQNIFGNPDDDESERKYLQKFDWGLNVGMEYHSKSGITIGGRYTYGLTDIVQYANSYTQQSTRTDAIRVYHQGMMFSAGYLFGRNKADTVLEK